MLQDDNLESSQVEPVRVIFSIGSNCGDRFANVSNGLNWLSKILSDFKSSHIYATPDCHGSNREYLNAVVSGISTSSPAILESLCKEYEASCGRDDISRKLGNVPIDIDLVIYDNNILRPNDFKREFFLIGYRTI